MEKLQTEKYYDYRPIIPMLICAFVPLVCCASVGPEAGLTGIIAALCYWTGDNVTYAKEHTREFSQIGEAVTLGQLFHSPLFGIFAVEEQEEGEAIPGLSKGNKLVLYGLSTAASFLTAVLLSSAFGSAMEGFPGFSEAVTEPRDYALLLLYIPVGLLLYLIYEFFEKITENLGEHIPLILRETPDPMGSGKIVGTDECEFRHVAKEMWANFARTGNPSTDKYQWKKFSGDDRQTMVFDDAIGMQKDIFGRREDLMMSWARRLGNGSSKRVC